MNLTHLACPLAGHGIVARYDLPGVRDEVRALLARKRSEGYVWLRTMVWWTSNAIGDPRASWGVVPIGIPEPYGSNLRNYLSDVRAAGFAPVEVAMGPAGLENPLEPAYSAMTFESSWQTIKTIHAIVAAVLPGAWYDVQNEGGHPAATQVSYDYAGKLWTRWVGSYGAVGATVSYAGDTWQPLSAVLAPKPERWESHVYGGYAPFTHPPDGRPVIVGEHFADVPAPFGVTHEAYWPLVSSGADTADPNCTTSVTP